jgi:hypothetical protein
VAVAELLAGLGLGGEASEEEAGVGGPDEAGGDDGVAFIVDAEASVIDEPAPGSFDDPAAMQGFEFVGFDTVDRLDSDGVGGGAVVNEGVLEPSVDPQLGEPGAFGGPTRLSGEGGFGAGVAWAGGAR